MPAPTVQRGEPMTNVAPDKGGVERDPMTIQAHAQLGGMDEAFLQSSVTMTTTAYREKDTIVVNVKITNDNTGHHIPTDSPLRQLILLVQVTNQQGQLLPLLDGAVLLPYAGTGDPQDGYYAGLPGKVFSKLLEELWTEVSPTGAYWNPVVVVSDNRLAAMDTDTSTYVFAMSEEGKSIIDVKLLYRRAFKTLMDQKEWYIPDIIVAQESIFLSSDN